MTAVFPFLGDTELEVLAVVGSFLLLAAHGITAFCTKEKVVVATKYVCVPLSLPSLTHTPQRREEELFQGAPRHLG